VFSSSEKALASCLDSLHLTLDHHQATNPR
jgi:hypothetical protein